MPTTIITTVPRPYTLTFLSSGTTYRVTSDEAQRLLDEYPAVAANPYRVILPGHNTASARERSILRPATLGGGPAFFITRRRR